MTLMLTRSCAPRRGVDAASLVSTLTSLVAINMDQRGVAVVAMPEHEAIEAIEGVKNISTIE